MARRDGETLTTSGGDWNFPDIFLRNDFGEARGGVRKQGPQILGHTHMCPRRQLGFRGGTEGGRSPHPFPTSCPKRQNEARVKCLILVSVHGHGPVAGELESVSSLNLTKAMFFSTWNGHLGFLTWHPELSSRLVCG